MVSAVMEMSKESVPVDTCFYRPQVRPNERKRSLCIGIGHKLRNGKGTVANHVVSTFRDLTIGHYGFANELKIELYDWFRFLKLAYPDLAVLAAAPNNLHANASDGDKLKWFETNRKYLRPFAQKFGTEFRRAEDELYWVRRLQTRIEIDQPDVALISDMRFANEAKMCDVTVRVDRNGYEHPDKAATRHASETELDDWKYDYIISASDGDLKSLKANAEEVFRRIFEERDLL